MESYHKLATISKKEVDVPIVSVIIPVFDSSKFLYRCLKSLKSQSTEDFEVICVCDKNMKTNMEVIEKLSKNDSRFCIVSSDDMNHNAAKNMGLKHAGGKYVHFLDSECRVGTCAYDRICKHLTDVDADMLLLKRRNIRTSDGYEQSFYENPYFFINDAFTGQNKIYKKKLIDDNGILFDENRHLYDSVFYLTLILKAKSITVYTSEFSRYCRSYCRISTRMRHPEYFTEMLRAYDSAMIVYRTESDDIKKSMTSVFLSNIFKMYDESPVFYKMKMYVMLHSFFQRLDLSHFGEEIAGWPWYRKYEYVRNNKAGFMSVRPLLISKYFAHTLKMNSDILESEARIHEGLIVSLTTLPHRIDTVHKTIESVLSQTILPEKIILWLPYENFSERGVGLPKSLKDLEERGVDIRYCEDIGSHTKYYYAMQEYPSHITITVDDDVIYRPDTVEMLLNSYFKFPDAVSCMRGKTITFANGKVRSYRKWIRSMNLFCDCPSMLTVPIGVGGVLYPPGIISEEAFDKAFITNACLYGDDLWLKTNQIMNGVPVVLTRLNRHPPHIDGTQEKALWRDNVMHGKNDRQLADIDAGMIEIYGFSPLNALSDYKYPKNVKNML